MRKTKAGVAMSKRSTIYFLLWGALVWCAGIFWVVWRWVPRVRVFRGARWTVSGRLVRSTQTVCPLDESVHESGMIVMGHCPADMTVTKIEGVRLNLGPCLIVWPRDA